MQMKKSDIKKVLNELGIKINLKGYSYLIEAVLIMNKYPNISIMNLYEKVAKKENTTISKVERAMRHAMVGNQDRAQNFFGFHYRLNNSILIKAIEDKVNNE